MVLATKMVRGVAKNIDKGAVLRTVKLKELIVVGLGKELLGVLSSFLECGRHDE